MSANPDLLSPGADIVSVTPLAAITRPMGNTKVSPPVYFFSTMETVSFHRPDGKKLPFIHHFMKCEIKEDIAYLMNEVNNDNLYIRLATAEEAQAAKMKENPIETIKEAVRAEVESNFSVEELQALIDRRRAAQAGVATSNADQAKIEGIDRLKNSGKQTVRAAGVSNPSGFTGATAGSVADAVAISTAKT